MGEGGRQARCARVISDILPLPPIPYHCVDPLSIRIGWCRRIHGFRKSEHRVAYHGIERRRRPTVDRIALMPRAMPRIALIALVSSPARRRMLAVRGAPAPAMLTVPTARSAVSRPPPLHNTTMLPNVRHVTSTTAWRVSCWRCLLLGPPLRLQCFLCLRQGVLYQGLPPSQYYNVA